MKKLFGLLVIGTVSAFVACTSDTDSNPYNVGDNNNNNNTSACPAETAPVMNANGGIDCIPIVAGVSSSSGLVINPVGLSSAGGITPVAVSSSDISVQPIPASSSAIVVNPGATTASSSSTQAPAATTPSSSSKKTAAVTPVEEPEDDGTFTLGLWDGSTGKNQVPTGNKKGGFWYSYTDSGNNGKSTLEWDTDVAVGSSYSDDDLSPVIEACGGLCGKFDLIAGANEDCAPYVAVAFNYGANDKTPGDATASKGICVTYKSSLPIEVDLGLGSKDATYGYNLPAVVLKSSTALTTVDYKWSEFEQQWDGDKALTGASAASMLVAVKFQIKGTEVGEDEGPGTFLITQVGGYGQCN